MTMEVITKEDVGIGLAPQLILEDARIAAKALADVLSKKKNPVIMNGEQYLEFEDWQTCGQFYGYTVKTGGAVLVEIDGVKGAKAHADLLSLKTGAIVGGAEAYCMRDEEHWNTRPKYEWQGEGDARRRVKVGEKAVPWFQLASMAQTRAGAKALRNRLAWVVVLAGYRPTPAEEMTGSTISEAVKKERTVDRTSHHCPIHDVNFFKRGQMKGYAHPIKDDKGNTTAWCNEDMSPPPKESEAISMGPDTEVAESPLEHTGLWRDWGALLAHCASRKPPASRGDILECIGKPDFSDTDPNEQWPKIKELLDIRKAEVTPEELPF